MRHSFGKPAGKVARIEIGQVMISVRCKDVHQHHAIEALRRAKFKFPGRQKVRFERRREGGREGWLVRRCVTQRGKRNVLFIMFVIVESIETYRPHLHNYSYPSTNPPSIPPSPLPPHRF